MNLNRSFRSFFLFLKMLVSFKNPQTQLQESYVEVSDQIIFRVFFLNGTPKNRLCKSSNPSIKMSIVEYSLVGQIKVERKPRGQLPWGVNCVKTVRMTLLRDDHHRHRRRWWRNVCLLFQVSLGVAICLDMVSTETLDLDNSKALSQSVKTSLGKV